MEYDSDEERNIRKPDKSKKMCLMDNDDMNFLKQLEKEQFIETNNADAALFKDIMMETSNDPRVKKEYEEIKKVKKVPKVIKPMAPPNAYNNMRNQIVDIMPPRFNDSPPRPPRVNHVEEPENDDEEILKQVMMDSLNHYEHAPVIREDDEDEILKKIILESIETAKLEEIARGGTDNPNLDDNVKISSNDIQNPNLDDDVKISSAIIQNPNLDDENDKNILTHADLLNLNFLLQKYENRKNMITNDIETQNSYTVIFNILNKLPFNQEHLNTLIENDYLKYIRNNKKSYFKEEYYNTLTKLNISS